MYNKNAFKNRIVPTQVHKEEISPCMDLAYLFKTADNVIARRVVTKGANSGDSVIVSADDSDILGLMLFGNIHYFILFALYTYIQLQVYRRRCCCDIKVNKIKTQIIWPDRCCY